MSVAVGNGLGDGLAVSHLRSSDDNLDTVGALEDVDLNVEVKLTHSLEDGFAGLFVGFDTEGGILFDHLADGDTEFLGLALVLGLNGEGDDGLREDHGLEGGGVVFVGQGVSGLDVLETHEGNDVTCLAAVALFGVVGMHLHDTADALGLTGEGVEEGVAFLESSGIDADEGQGSEAVVHDLEGQGTEGQEASTMADLPVSLPSRSTSG